MKTIRSLSALVLSAASLTFAAQAQEIRDVPPTPAAPERPEQLDPQVNPPGTPGIQYPHAEPREKRVQRRMLDQVRRELMVPGDPAGDEAPKWLIGISVEPLEPFVRAHLDLGEGAGARVSMVADGSPAEKAGMQIDDIIISADGQKVANLEGLKSAVEKCGKEGRPVAMEILHRGERKALSIEPNGPKPPRDRDVTRPQPERPMLDIMRRLERQEKELAELRAELRRLQSQLDQKPGE